MSETAFRRGTDPIVRETVFRILTSEIRITVNCPWVEGSLKYLVQNARHELPVNRRLDYTVCEEDGAYSVWEDSAPVGANLSRDSVLTLLFRHIQDRTLAAMPDWIRVHAGCGEIGARRFMVAGGKYNGKSTLMASLLFAGVNVFCDELTLLRDGVAIPVPRKFYVREGSLPFIPQLGRLAPHLPFVHNSVDGRVVAFDPQEAGFDWRIAPAPVDTVFYLLPNHGGTSRLEPCPKYLMAERVMKQCNPPEHRDRNWVGDICATIDRAETYELHVGDLDQALAVITGALRRNPSPFTG